MGTDSSTRNSWSELVPDIFTLVLDALSPEMIFPLMFVSKAYFSLCNNYVPTKFGICNDVKPNMDLLRFLRDTDERYTKVLPSSNTVEPIEGKWSPQQTPLPNEILAFVSFDPKLQTTKWENVNSMIVYSTQLANPGVNGKSPLDLGNFFSHLLGLRSIMLYGLEITESLIDGLKKLPKLELVFFNYCSLKEDENLYLAEWCPKKLHISLNQLSKAQITMPRSLVDLCIRLPFLDVSKKKKSGSADFLVDSLDANSLKHM